MGSADAVAFLEVDGGPPWLAPAGDDEYSGIPEPGPYAFTVRAVVMHNGVRSEPTEVAYAGVVPCQPPVWETPETIGPVVSGLPDEVRVVARSHAAAVAYEAASDPPPSVSVSPTGAVVVDAGLHPGGEVAVEVRARASVSDPDVPSAETTRTFRLYAARLGDARTELEAVSDVAGSLTAPPGAPVSVVRAVHVEDLATRFDVWTYTYALARSTDATFEVDGVPVFRHVADAAFASAATFADGGAPVALSGGSDRAPVYVAELDRRAKRARVTCLASSAAAGDAAWADAPTMPHAWTTESWTVAAGAVGSTVFSSAARDPRVRRALAARPLDPPAFPFATTRVAVVGDPFDANPGDPGFHVAVLESDMIGSGDETSPQTTGRRFARLRATEVASGLHVDGTVTFHVVSVDWDFEALPRTVRVGDDVSALLVPSAETPVDADVAWTVEVRPADGGVTSTVEGAVARVSGVPTRDGELRVSTDTVVTVDGASAATRRVAVVEVLKALPVWRLPDGESLAYVGDEAVVELLAESEHPVEYASTHALAVVVGATLTMPAAAAAGAIDVPLVARVDDRTETDAIAVVRSIARAAEWGAVAAVTASEAALGDAAPPSATAWKIAPSDARYAPAFRLVCVVEPGSGAVTILANGETIAVVEQGVARAPGGAAFRTLRSDAPSVLSLVVRADGTVEPDGADAGPGSATYPSTAVGPLASASATASGGARVGTVFAIPAFDATFADAHALDLSPPPIAREVVVAPGAFDAVVADPDAAATLVDGGSVATGLESGRVLGAATEAGAHPVRVRYARANGTTVETTVVVRVVSISWRPVDAIDVEPGAPVTARLFAYASDFQDELAFRVAGEVPDGLTASVDGNALEVLASSAGERVLSLEAEVRGVSVATSVVVRASAPTSATWLAPESIQARGVVADAGAPVAVEIGAIPSDAGSEVRYVVDSVSPVDASARVEVVADRRWCVLSAESPGEVVASVRAYADGADGSPGDPADGSVAVARAEFGPAVADPSDGRAFRDALADVRSSAEYETLARWLPLEGMTFVPRSAPVEIEGRCVVYAGAGEFEFRACEGLRVEHSAGAAVLRVRGEIAASIGEPDPDTLVVFALAVRDRYVYLEAVGGESVGYEMPVDAASLATSVCAPEFRVPTASAARCGAAVLAPSLRDEGFVRWALGLNVPTGLAPSALWRVETPPVATVGEPASARVLRRPGWSSFAPGFVSAAPPGVTLDEDAGALVAVAAEAGELRGSLVARDGAFRETRDFAFVAVDAAPTWESGSAVVVVDHGPDSVDVPLRAVSTGAVSYVVEHTVPRDVDARVEATADGVVLRVSAPVPGSRVYVSARAGGGARAETDARIALALSPPVWRDPATETLAYAGDDAIATLRAESAYDVRYSTEHFAAVVHGATLTLPDAPAGATEILVEARVGPDAFAARVVAVRALERVASWDVVAALSAGEASLGDDAAPATEWKVAPADATHVPAFRLVCVVEPGPGAVSLVANGAVVAIAEAGVAKYPSGETARALRADAPAVLSAVVYADGSAEIDGAIDGVPGARFSTEATGPLATAYADATGGARAGTVFVVPAFDATFARAHASDLAPAPLAATEVVVAVGPFDAEVAGPDAAIALLDGGGAATSYAAGRLSGACADPGAYAATLRFTRSDGTFVDAVVVVRAVALAWTAPPPIDARVGETASVPLYAYSTAFADELTIGLAGDASGGLTAEVVGNVLTVVAVDPGEFEATLVAEVRGVRAFATVRATVAAVPTATWLAPGDPPETRVTADPGSPVAVEIGALPREEGALVRYAIESVEPASASARLESVADRWWCVLDAPPATRVDATVRAWADALDGTPGVPSDGVTAVVRAEFGPSAPDAVPADLDLADSVAGALSSAEYDVLAQWVPNADMAFVARAPDVSVAGRCVLYGGSGEFTFRACDGLEVVHATDSAVLRVDGRDVANAAFSPRGSALRLFALTERDGYVRLEAVGDGAAAAYDAAASAAPGIADAVAAAKLVAEFRVPDVERAACGSVVLAPGLRDEKLVRWATSLDAATGLAPSALWRVVPPRRAIPVGAATSVPLLALGDAPANADLVAGTSDGVSLHPDGASLIVEPATAGAVEGGVVAADGAFRTVRSFSFRAEDPPPEWDANVVEVVVDPGADAATAEVRAVSTGEVSYVVAHVAPPGLDAAVVPAPGGGAFVTVARPPTECVVHVAAHSVSGARAAVDARVVFSIDPAHP